ncbi:hypothetical protein F8154_10300 [Alkaliphilus pronyensis]|uniref:Large polyvalent protein associated domain-containing protein n=1 Tax=Alkaliphilus pronyensis TaxID=1482732 RepID=A0A6I0FA06_9FIRM|nr:hypothetical protein [Alkaliphilus pronyensis]KAB3533850.1 hypothetical protein F8154_10300 [Alkaliphilus pronyensis]
MTRDWNNILNPKPINTKVRDWDKITRSTQPTITEQLLQGKTHNNNITVTEQLMRKNNITSKNATVTEQLMNKKSINIEKISVEKLYKEIKSGRVKLENLNDEGKRVLKEYMTQNSNAPSPVKPAFNDNLKPINLYERPRERPQQKRYIVSPREPQRFQSQTLSSPTTIENKRLETAGKTLFSGFKNFIKDPLGKNLQQKSIDEFDNIISSKDPLRVEKVYNIDINNSKEVQEFRDLLVKGYSVPDIKQWKKEQQNQPSTGLGKGLKRASQTSRDALITTLEGTPSRPKEYLQDTGSKAGNLISGGLGQLSTEAAKYMTAAKIAPMVPGVNKISNPFLRTQTADLLVDNIAQTPQTISEGIQDKKGIGGIAKDIAKQNVLDLGINLTIGGVGELLKRSPNLLKRVKEGKVTPQEATDIIKELNLPKDTTPASFLKEMEDLSKEIEVENYYRRFETPKLEPPKLKPKLQPKKIEPPKLKAKNQTATAADVLPIKPILKVPTSGTKKTSFSKTITNSELGSMKLKDLINNNPVSYEPITNKETLSLAQEIVEGNFEAAKNLVKSGNSFDNAVESAMAQDVIRKLQSTAKTTDQWNEVFEIMETVAQKFKSGGQVIQSASMWRRMTPEGMLKYAQSVFDQANEALSASHKIKLTSEFAERITEGMKRIQSNDNIIDLIKEQSKARNIPVPKWIEKELFSVTTEKLNDIAIAQMLSTIADEVPVNVARKISSFQAISHLFNAKTMIRNILGNTVFAGSELTSTGTATIWDNILSKITGKRSVTLPKLTGTLKEARKRGKEAALDIALGIDRTGVTQGKYNIPKGRTFKDGLLAKAERGLRYALNVPDEYAKGFMGKNVRNQLEVIGGLKATEIDDIVKKAELYSTFQDKSLPAKILQGTKDLANKIGVGNKVIGSSGQVTKEFGLGDLIVKYTTVPGNIISRGIEYSPIGFLKVLNIIDQAKKTGVLNQRDLAMTLGRATNGSLLIGMGVLMNRMGLIQSEDKNRSLKALALDRAEGLGVNKVNMSALRRFLNGENTKAQPGDILQTFAWLDPLSIALSVGVSIDNEIKKGGTKEEVLWRSSEAALEDMLDLPTLSIIRKLTYAQGVYDRVIIPLAEGASGFVPGPIRQLAQTTDPVARNTYSKKPLTNLNLKLKGSIPGLKKSLEPRLTPFGEEIKYPKDPFNVFLNPAQTSIYQPKKISNKLRRLEELTGETTQYPAAKAPNSFVHNKETITLTPQEKTQYQQIAGKRVEENYSNILSNIDIDNLNDRQRILLIEKLEKAQRQAREYAKKYILQEKRR